LSRSNSRATAVLPTIKDADDRQLFARILNCAPEGAVGKSARAAIFGFNSAEARITTTRSRRR